MLLVQTESAFKSGVNNQTYKRKKSKILIRVPTKIIKNIFPKSCSSLSNNSVLRVKTPLQIGQGDSVSNQKVLKLP